MPEEKKKKDRIARFFEIGSPTMRLFTGCLMDVASVLLLLAETIQFCESHVNVLDVVVIGIISVAITILIAIHLYNLLAQCFKQREYSLILLERSFSEGALHALEHIEEAKKKYVLQSTYGNVPEWRPTDYTRNVLVYDVHEQIRTMLFSLRNLIMSQTDGLTEDQITVDFVYCYPDFTDSNGYTGSLPYPSSESADDHKGEKAEETSPCCPITSAIHSFGSKSRKFFNRNRDKDSGNEAKSTSNYPWRLITSGNHSLGGSIKTYLGRENSFFYHVSEKGFVFCNDKRRLLYDHYAPSCKDKIYKNQGSIIGLMFELRNDAPEAVFVRGILTITTYGKKLHDQQSVPLDEYKRIFKEKILNSFESALYSELVQMYIRHAIRDGDMCPKTGRHISSLPPHGSSGKSTYSSTSTTTKTCIYTHNVCKFEGYCCKGFCCQLPHGSVPNRSNP